ncbi:hypothetical protein [Tahibacter harae]|uniref:Uncharacterized protein n=1 Tax=Tahibacter harae TaxID=2963937 RepID=A0ABT1QXG2_9GAMM|nr:hypothetical protein [Tahibacter harae]MCQ4166963.1 hypothetical protein [Tahibacter harae]
MAAHPVDLAGAVPSAAAHAALTFPGWRVRGFWRWQAWRLRKARAQEPSHGVALYDSVHTLDRLGYVDEFCRLHHDLMRPVQLPDPDTPAAFARRLARELCGHCTAALLATPEGGVGGYAWGRLGALDETLQHFRQVPALAHLGSEDWRVLERRANAHVGDAAVLAVGGIGLASRYRRGFTPLKQLLKPLLDLAQGQGVSRALWWVPRGSALESLSLGFGARRLLQTPYISVFLLADLRPLARVFSALPACGIADLLARVAPARPPQRQAPRLSVIGGKARRAEF